MKHGIGKFLIDRSFFFHPIFGERNSKNKLCEIAAFQWLVAAAVYDDIEISPNKYGVQDYELWRGQCSYSFSYLARAWGWEKHAVKRFMHKLAEGIPVAGSDGITVSKPLIELHRNSSLDQYIITICNYDEMQQFKSRKEDD